ncbi:MAG: glycosyltransferase family 4 protein [Firmicutes bacterium]|jgi:glycosyltransferase involved in cell wall biosynthesis|nr:glycosyltransferase family 4 protein [Bacillota bacterium]
MNKKLTILFLSWRDIKAPKKGGAEVYTHEMLKRVDKDKYNIIHFSPLYEGGKEEEVIDGIKYIRKGNILSVIYHSIKYYRKNRKNIDYVVDQCNTHRFFAPLWVSKAKRIFFIHQFTRDIWFRNMKFPVSHIGYRLENTFLRFSRKDNTMTVSNSTMNDLIDIGFDKDKVKILPEGINFEHWDKKDFMDKEDDPTFIYVGRYAKYKGIDDAVEAFGKFKEKTSKGKLWLVGKRNDTYIKEKLQPICDKYEITIGEDEINDDVVTFGFVSDEKKLELMSRSHILLFPSNREGWGLIVTEAAAVGTPSIVYNSAGLVDAVDNGKAGMITSENNHNAILGLMEELYFDDKSYEAVRNAAYDFSLKFHWDHTAVHFDRFITNIEG